MSLFPFEPAQPSLRVTATVAGLVVDLTTLAGFGFAAGQLRVFVRGGTDVFGAWTGASGGAPACTAANGYIFPGRSDQVITVGANTTRIFLISPDGDCDVHLSRGNGG